MGILAMMMLWSTGSQAQEISLQDTLNALKRPSRPPSKSVPEPSSSLLLMLGIGISALTGYSLQRYKYGE
jgi:hypothetical protein